MRYSFSAEAAPAELADEIRRAGRATEGANPDQVSAVAKLASTMARQLAAYPTVHVVIEGHANPTHEPTEGEANDYLRIRVSTSVS